MNGSNAPKTKQKLIGLAVAGADMDANMVALLSAGDKVLVEVNGARIISEHDCPLVAEHPWTVISNQPPSNKRRPTDKNVLVLAHPEDDGFELVLHYSNILLGAKQPAIFEEPKAGLSIQDGVENNCIILLQFLSHYLSPAQVKAAFPPHNATQAALLLDDEEWSKVVINEWVTTLRTFGLTGWGVKSLKRFALRAGITLPQAKSLRARNWIEIEKFDRDTLLRIHAAFHWSDHFIAMAPLFTPPPPKEVVGNPQSKTAASKQRGTEGNNAPKEERSKPR